MEDIYVCSTYFHVLITLIKVMKCKNNSSIVITSTIDNPKDIIRRLKLSKLFSNIYFYDELEVRKIFKEKNIERKIFRKNEMIDLFNKNSNINFFEFDNIYIYNDWTTIGAYLIDSKLKYHLIEDGIDAFYYIKGNFKDRITFLNPNLNYKIKAIIKKIFNIGYDFFGQSKYVIDIEVNDKNKIFIKNKNIIEVRKEFLYNSLTEEEKMKIYNIFISNNIQVSSKDKSILLLTQPLYIDKMVDTNDDQIDIYIEIINKYIKNYKIYIKPHPRDIMDYKKINKDVIIIDKKLPIEILKFNKNINFEKAITITSSSVFKRTFNISRFAEKLLPEPGVPRIKPFIFLLIFRLNNKRFRETEFKP